jgi:mannose-6-phosphate isomerase-like protein (cupin superfamily)
VRTEDFMARQVTVTSGKNYTAGKVGRLDELDQYEFLHPKLRRPARGKLFLKQPLGLTGMELSLNKLPAGAAVPFLHRHKAHEELYLFVRGKGEFQVDGEVIPIEEGTAIRISPEGARAYRNNSTEDLYYVCIQARNGSMPDAEAGSDGAAVEGKPSWPS